VGSGYFNLEAQNVLLEYRVDFAEFFSEYAEVWNGEEGIDTRNLIFLFTDVAHVPPCSFVYSQWNVFCQPE
jgi:hypothetical protein